jgi:hypothetical protein
LLCKHHVLFDGKTPCKSISTFYHLMKHIEISWLKTVETY